MRRCVLVCALGIPFLCGQSEKSKFVSLAAGVKLYETQDGDVLRFTLENTVPMAIHGYTIETWITNPRGIPVRDCVVRSDDTVIDTGSTVSAASTCARPATPHSSRIVALRFADGSEWRPPAQSYPLYRYSPRR